MHKNLSGISNIMLPHSEFINKYYLICEDDLYGVSIEKYANESGNEVLIDFDIAFPFTESIKAAEAIVEKLIHNEVFPEHLIEIIDDYIE